jgi:hypothetical protein
VSRACTSSDELVSLSEKVVFLVYFLLGMSLRSVSFLLLKIGVGINCASFDQRDETNPTKLVK